MMKHNHNCAECDRLLADYSHAVNEFLFVETKLNVALLSDAGAAEIDALEAKRQNVAAVRDLRRQEFTDHFRTAHCAAADAAAAD